MTTQNKPPLSKPPGKPRAPAKPAWLQLAQAFVAGALAPSRLMLAAFLISTLLMLVLALWMFSPSGMRGYAGTFIPRTTNDAEGFVTVEALRIAEQQQRPNLVILGTSTIAQGLGREQAIQQALAQAGAGDWDVHMLSTPLQSPLDQVTLLDTVLSNRGEGAAPVLVVIGQGVLRLQWTAKKMLDFENHARLGLRSEWTDRDVEAMGGTVRPYYGWAPFDNYRFMLLNGTEAIMRLFAQRPAERVIDSYSPGLLSIPYQERNRSLTLQYLAKAVEQSDALFDLQRRLEQRLQAIPGVHLAYLQEGLSPDLHDNLAHAEAYKKGEASLSAFLSSVSVPYWPIFDDVNVADGEFYDDYHVVRGVTQERLRADFARHVAELKILGR